MRDRFFEEGPAFRKAFLRFTICRPHCIVAVLRTGTSPANWGPHGAARVGVVDREGSLRLDPNQARTSSCVVTSKPCTTSNHPPLKKKFARLQFRLCESSVASTNLRSPTKLPSTRPSMKYPGPPSNYSTHS